MRGEAREKILQAACELFYEQGIHATGIEAVVERAGVTKMTLYKHFASKQDLILAVLQKRDVEWLEWFRASVERYPVESGGRLLGMFDILDRWFREEEFGGCPFLKAVSEFSQQDHAVHREVADHYGRVRNYIAECVHEVGTPIADGLTDALYLLFTGAISLAFATNRRDMAVPARRTAQTLLANYNF